MPITFDGSYDHVQRAYGDYWASAQSMPVNTRAIVDEWIANGPFECAGGTVEIVVQLVTGGTLKGGGAITLTVEHATVSAAGYFFTLGTAEFMILASQTLAAGQILMRFALPSSTYRYQKAYIASNDATPHAATIDVFPVLLPR